MIDEEEWYECLCTAPQPSPHAISRWNSIEKLFGINREEYQHTNAWRTRREFLKDFVNHQCECCGAGYSLVVHHLTYQRLGYELMEDLLVLCEQCHDVAHAHCHEWQPPDFTVRAETIGE